MSPPATWATGRDAVITPAIIEGRIVHRRERPARNAFTYRSFCLRVPLSQLGALDAAGIATHRRGIVSFRERDHGPGDGTSLDAWMRAHLAAEGIAAPGEIVLYAFPRMLGCVFNPVSFWVCHDARQRIVAVLAEVNNTFGERHNYLLAAAGGATLRNGETLAARKVFHVSPFCTVSGRYLFRFHEHPERWLARIDYHDDASDVPLLATSIFGHARPLTRAAVRGLLWRYPAFTAGVVARIHWQALRLWAKRVPHYAKPAPPATFTTR